MTRVVLASLVLGLFAFLSTGIAQTGAPLLKECEPGAGPLPQPPASEGCVRAECSTETCYQPGTSINMRPGECRNTWPTPCKFKYGPTDTYHHYICVSDYSICEDPEFGCKWQVVAGSGFLTKLLTCYNE